MMQLPENVSLLQQAGIDLPPKQETSQYQDVECSPLQRKFAAYAWQ